MSSCRDSELTCAHPAAALGRIVGALGAAAALFLALENLAAARVEGDSFAADVAVFIFSVMIALFCARSAQRRKNGVGKPVQLSASPAPQLSKPVQLSTSPAPQCKTLGIRLTASPCDDEEDGGKASPALQGGTTEPWVPPSFTAELRAEQTAFMAVGGAIRQLQDLGTVRELLSELLVEPPPSFATTSAVELLSDSSVRRVDCPETPLSLRSWVRAGPIVSLPMRRVPQGRDLWAEIRVEGVCGHARVGLLLGVCPAEPDLATVAVPTLADVPGCVFGVPRLSKKVRFKPGTVVGVLLTAADGGLTLFADGGRAGQQACVFDPLKEGSVDRFHLLVDLSFDVSACSVSDGFPSWAEPSGGCAGLLC